METTVSKILFLDRNYQPVGTRVIRRPGIMSHNDRTDSKKIMAVGMGAFDDGDFDKVPRYWVPFSGDIKDFNELHLEVNIFINGIDRIEEVLSKHFRFISLYEVERKVERIKSLLGFKESYRPAEFIITPHGWIKENQTVVSLCGGADGLKFSLCDFLHSLQVGIDECTGAIEATRRQIAERRKNMRFIIETISTFRNNRTISDHVNVGNDCYVDYNKFSKLLFSPAYNNMVNIIHDLKKRMQELERQRSYMQMVMQDIMARVWLAN